MTLRTYFWTVPGCTMVRLMSFWMMHSACSVGTQKILKLRFVNSTIPKKFRCNPSNSVRLAFCKRSFVSSFDFRLTQDGQCTYNVILRRVRATIVVVDSNKYCIFWVCICRLRYPACNAHAPNFHPWPARLYSILPNCLINATILKKKLLNVKCVFFLYKSF